MKRLFGLFLVSLCGIGFAQGDSAPGLVAEGGEWRKLGEGYKFTEGPAVGPEGKIYFNDIPNENTHVYDPETGVISLFRANTGRANGMFFTSDGAMLVCEGGNRRVSRIYQEKETVLVSSFEGKKLNSPNDIVPDSSGGFYFTDPRYGKRDNMELEVEAVYYVGRNGAISRVAGDLTKPNGIILSPDGKVLYVADPGAETIWAYDVDGPGKISGKRKFAGVGSDGMTVDRSNNLYCTWKGEVIVFAPGGDEILRVSPPEAPANCLLVGKTLYVTARKGFYAIEMNVSGVK